MEMTFGAFTFDEAARQLRCGVEVVHLSPKAFELLHLLIQRCPDAVSKPDLHRELWPDTFVTDGSLAVLIAEIRRAIGDTAHHPRFIRTVNRFGYAFVAPQSEAMPVTSSPNAVAAALMWGGDQLRLKHGENVLGRDPDADLRIDAVGVSRRHAAVLVENDHVSLRDLGSKNGTFVNGARISASVRLPDNAEIRIGVIHLRFQRLGLGGLTQTLEQSPEPQS